MRLHIVYVLLLSLVWSCSKPLQPKGDYRLLYTSNLDNDSFPYELQFKGDSLILIDGYLYTHKTKFVQQGSQIHLTFSNGQQSTLSFQVLSDTSLVFGQHNYYKIPEKFMSTIPSYQLFGYKTKNKLDMKLSTDIIHLTHLNGQPKLILNDSYADIKEIEGFLSGGHISPINHLLYLYIGKNTTFKDLIKTYSHLQVLGIKNIRLVTDNDTFKQFYGINDRINLDLTLLKSNLGRSYPPFPRKPLQSSLTDSLYINNIHDFKLLDELNPSTPHLVLVSSELPLEDYFRLTELLNTEKFKGYRKKIIDPNSH